jgi:alpha-amylase/alpha-mannosidase (GH57 family)
MLHALGLQMHQPPGNLQLLIETNVPEAQQIIYAYDRATRYAHKYPQSARLHIGFSGVLLEQLRNPVVIDSYRRFIDIPAMLNSYAEAGNIELVGTGYYHPIFPLIPRDSWRDQLVSEQQLMQAIFGRKPRGFYAPEMAFCMEMIPTLVDLGYEYVIVDAAYIQPQHAHFDGFKPYQVCYEGKCIAVVPRHHVLSSAQEYGLDPIQLVESVQPYCATPSTEPRLLTTWSNGENSAWLRDESAGFFQRFFAPYMEHLENAQYPLQPVLLSEWLHQHPPTTYAEVHAGYDSEQWRGSEHQHHALSHLHYLFKRYQEVAAASPNAALLPQIHQELLQAESSCFLFWGESWLEQLHTRLFHIEKLLNVLENAAVVATPTEVAPLPPAGPPEEPLEKSEVAEAEPSILPSPVLLAKRPIMGAVAAPQPSAPVTTPVIQDATSSATDANSCRRADAT